MAYGKPNKISSQKIIDVVPVKYKKDLADKNNDLYKYLEAIYLKDKKYKYIDSVNYRIYFNNKETTKANMAVFVFDSIISKKVIIKNRTSVIGLRFLSDVII